MAAWNALTAFIIFSLCGQLKGDPSPTCETITIPMCQNVGYNQTRFPNHFNHADQSEAGMELQAFHPLVEVDCSPDLQFFLCSVYAPVCTVMNMIIPPCRRLCESSRDGCLPIMDRFGFPWPAQLACDRFPEESTSLCIDNLRPATTASPPSVTSTIPTTVGNVTSSNTRYPPTVPTVTATPRETPKLRLEFEAKYRVSCDVTKGKESRDIIKQAAILHFEHIEDICNDSCSRKGKAKPKISCSNDTLTITWPTDQTYKRRIPSKVSDKLIKKLEDKGSMMMIYLPSQTEDLNSFMFPEKNADGSSARLTLTPSCRKRFVYSTDTRSCIRP